MSFANYILILASAGSGKTYRLTHHLIRVLYHGVFTPRGPQEKPWSIDAALAATFTRKAAAEIVERVLERLAQGVLDPKARADIGQEIGVPGLAAEQCQLMLQRVAQDLGRLRICTLDAFLVRCAQTFSPELGIDQPWTILDDAADLQARYEAIDALVEAAMGDAESRREMQDLLFELNKQRYPMSVRDLLQGHLSKAYAMLLAGPQEAWEAIGPEEGQMMGPDELAAYCRGLFAKLNPLTPLTKAGKPVVLWSDAIRILCDAASRGDWDDLAELTLIAAVRGNRDYARHPIPQAMAEHLAPLLDHLAGFVLSRLRDQNLSTRDLLMRFDAAYRQAKVRRGGWRFDDFARLLGELEVEDRLEELYFRLDGRIDHVLLDEFQDTSIPQWRFLEPLIDQILSGEQANSPTPRTFFCVGDVKQTLYGWRNAEPRLVGELKKRWPHLEQEQLVVSRRSAPVIIKTVNQVFENMRGNRALTGEPHFVGACTEWGQWFTPHETVHANLAGFCRMFVCENADSSPERCDLAMRLAADRVKTLADAMPGADIAILVRRKRFIARILYYLKQRGIEASGEGGSPVTDDPAVCAVLSLLHLVDHPSDGAAQYHVGTSPLGAALGVPAREGRNDVLRVTNQIRRQIMDTGLDTVLNDWMAQCAPSCSERNLGRWRQLVELAHHAPVDGCDLGTFIEYVRTCNVEDAAASRVRVMTIHGSKGRQFKVVVLPDLDGRFLGGGVAPLLIERQSVLEPAGCISHGMRDKLLAFCPRLAAMSEAACQRIVVEELCALYVAMTRAQVGLEMIVHPQLPNKSGDVNLAASAAGVLRAALMGTGALPPSDKPCWEHKDNVEIVEKPAGPEPADVPARAPLRVALAAPHGASRLRPQVTASGLEGNGFIHLKGMLSLSQSTGLERGTLMHRWFQLIEWLDLAAPTDEQLRRAAGELGPIPPNLAGLIAQFRKACSGKQIGPLLRRKSYADRGPMLEVWRERPFAVAVDDYGGAVLHGQFDRVVVVQYMDAPVAAELIDFKTDAVAPGSAQLKQAVERYRPQVLAYHRAVTLLTGLKSECITARLAFTEADLVVPITP